ncbi:hypothetical protein [Virgibacillus sp. YIM 98842]|uniref:hypothetical protein n=1 Tax=Virgibacillus sp. YIM 98842 TaxID=2663533 RepID=UPI0013D9E806|nr:hypothetical protein [Virgibacillus sp. YIM 98842]
MLLAVGQVSGQLFAGVFIGTWGYGLTFIVYGVFVCLLCFWGRERESDRAGILSRPRCTPL